MYYNPYLQNNGAMPDMLGQLRTQQPANNGIIWVQGEIAAKAYPVAPNATVMLFDSENSVFYLKTSDASGMPLPMRVFDYTERKNNTQNITNFGANQPEVNKGTNYVTHEELNDILANFALGNKTVNKTTEGESE